MTDPVVRNSVAVADPSAPQNYLKPNADGSINVNGGTGGGAGTGINGSTAPTSSLSNGYTNAAGNQTAVSPSTPLPVQNTGGAIYTGQTTVGTGAAQISSTNQALVTGMNVYNSGTVTIYAGGPGVTTSSGFPIPAGTTANFPVNNENILYAVSGTAGQPVSWVGV